MDICITAQGPDLMSRFEPHFARAPYFVLYDSRTGSADAIRNGYIVNDSKIGQNVVKLLSTHRIRAVITGNVGQNARNLLRSTKISLHVWQGEGTVREAIAAIMPDALKRENPRAGAGKRTKTAKRG